MERAYVLINCDTGSEESIINKLKDMGSVKEVHGTFGIPRITISDSSKSLVFAQQIVFSIPSLFFLSRNCLRYMA